MNATSTRQRRLRVLREVFRARPWIPAHARALWDHALFTGARTSSAADVAEGILRCVDWLCRAQDRGAGGGVAAWYALDSGWAAAYPETTGYIIDSFYDAAAALGREDLRERARRMARWELTVQMEDGSFPGGLLGSPPKPVVFNTGQVLQGLVRAVREEQGGGADGAFLSGLTRAADWLVRVQAPDGSWPRFEYENRPHAYHTRVAWPLAAAARMRGRDDWEAAARRNLDWCLGRRREKAWLEDCSFDGATDPPTHTIFYAVEGLLEAGRILGDDRYVDFAGEMAEEGLRIFELRRWMPGAFRAGWKAAHRPACCTGNAQAAICWLRLFELRGDARRVNAALKMIDLLLSMQSRDPHPDLRGALPGSLPHWGPYMTLRYPNWAAKFLLDALLISRRVMAALGEAYPRT